MARTEDKTTSPGLDRDHPAYYLFERCSISGTPNAARRWGWGILCCFAFGTTPATAHEDLSKFVHHVATFSVDSSNIDVTVRLTFYGNHALAERAHMDADGDGGISGDELRGYVNSLIETTAEAATIRMGSQALPTVPLYDPEVNLQGDSTRSTAPLEIQLVYFARRPSTVAGGAEFLLEDTLWNEAPALCITRSAVGQGQNSVQGRAVRTPAGDTHRHAVDWQSKYDGHGSGAGVPPAP